MLTQEGAPILIDFGIAHPEGVGTGHTTMSTAKYAPPEQQGGDKVDPTADLYALGMTLRDCLGDAQVQTGLWGEIISKLTHFLPATRGTAEALVEALSDEVATYHATTPGANPEGPLKLSEVVERVLGGADQLYLWWSEATAWTIWSDVDAVLSQGRWLSEDVIAFSAHCCGTTAALVYRIGSAKGPALHNTHD